MTSIGDAIAFVHQSHIRYIYLPRHHTEIVHYSAHSPLSSHKSQSYHKKSYNKKKSSDASEYMIITIYELPDIAVSPTISYCLPWSWSVQYRGW